jgi:hypothetical protein
MCQLGNCRQPDRRECSSGDACPSGRSLCELHTECCMHCGRFFCRPCRDAHQAICGMRPTEPGLWQQVEKILSDQGMT